MPHELPFDPAVSPLATAAAWMLARYDDGELTPEQASDPRWVYPVENAERRCRSFGEFRRPISKVLSYEELDGYIARIGVLDDRGRRLMVRVLQHPNHPGRVWQTAMMLDPPGVSVREALVADTEQLRALELATPVQHDGFEVAYSRPDPFAQDRLRPRPVARCVAVIDGQVVGAHTDAMHQLILDDGPVEILYRQQARVLPDAQGRGVMPAMNGFQAELIFRDGIDREVLGFIARGNEKIRAWTGRVDDAPRDTEWRVPIVRYTLDTSTLAAEPNDETRLATAADEELVCRLLNAAHEHEVLWPGPAEGWLRARLGRSPTDYGWADLVVSEHAVVGMWDAGWETVRSVDGTPSHHRVATILDWGFSLEHPRKLIAALQATCSRAVAQGVTRLYAFAGPPPGGHTVLQDVACDEEPFDLFAPDLPEPPRTATDGIYVDPLYF